MTFSVDFTGFMFKVWDKFSLYFCLHVWHVNISLHLSNPGAVLNEHEMRRPVEGDYKHHKIIWKKNWCTEKKELKQKTTNFILSNHGCIIYLLCSNINSAITSGINKFWYMSILYFCSYSPETINAQFAGLSWTFYEMIPIEMSPLIHVNQLTIASRCNKIRGK